MKKLYRIMIFTVALLCLPVTASAQSTEDKIRSLEATVEQLQQTLIEMRAEIAKVKQASASESGGVVRTEGENVTLSTTGGGIKLKSDNGNSFQFGGRLMLDYDAFDFDGSNGGTPIGDSGDSSEAEWRRTRLTAKGTVKKDWSYGFTLNITDDEDKADINTAYIKYGGFKPFSLTVGKFKEPFGLERLTSSKWITAIERAMIWEVVEGQGQPELGGVMVSAHHPEMANLNWALGVFDDGMEDADKDDNYALTGRVAVAPRFSEDSFLHLGVAFSERDRDKTPYRVRTRFGVHTINDDCSGCRPDLARWGKGDDASQWGLEVAFVKGPFSLQAEYVDLEVDGSSDVVLKEDDGERRVDYSDLEGDGYYIQGAWTLTGEQRSYKTSGAYFDKIKPKGAMGAWELVARYEEIDVEHDGEVANVNDTSNHDAEKMLLGVNWYANNNVKFMLNYIDADADGSTVNIDGDAISLRAQYAF